MMNQSADLTPLFNYTNYTNAKTIHNESYYLPAVDFFGPYNFIPRYCYAEAVDNKTFALPIVAYIDRNNTI
jgi:hypothetical protein